MDNQAAVLDPAVRLRVSARGWSSIQLALIGFIGLCGVLQSPGGPYDLQVTAGLLALSALLLAVLAAALVALVAWPLGADGPVRGPGLLRAGVALTLIAGALIALAGVSGWWPERAADSALVEVGDATGRTLCGQLDSSESGVVTLRVGTKRVAIPFESIASLRPVDACD